MLHIRPVTARLAPHWQIPSQHFAPYKNVSVAVLYGSNGNSYRSLHSHVCGVYVHMFTIYRRWLDQKKRRRSRRTAVNAANKGELAACHTFVSPGVESRLRDRLPSHVSIPRFGQFYTPKRPGRLWLPPNPYSKALGEFFPVGKGVDHDVNHSPSSSAKVWNEWNYISTPPYAFNAVHRYSHFLPLLL